MDDRIVLHYEVKSSQEGEDFMRHLGWLHVHATVDTPTGSTIHLATASRKLPWEHLDDQGKLDMNRRELEALVMQIAGPALADIKAARS